MIASTPALIGTGNPEAGDYAGYASPIRTTERLNMTEPNSPREAVEQHRESLYPPLPPAELVDALGFENLTRVVVAQHGVYGRAIEGHWFQLKPLAEMYRDQPKLVSREAFGAMEAAMSELEQMPGMPQLAPMGESGAKFKVGDVVVLRSGGPKMTIYSDDNPNQLIETVWFAGAELRRNAFSEAELELAPA